MLRESAELEVLPMDFAAALSSAPWPEVEPSDWEMETHRRSSLEQHQHPVRLALAARRFLVRNSMRPTR